MRQVPFGLRVRGRIVAGLLAVAVLAPAAWGYVNGGVHVTTVWKYRQDLWAQNWAVSTGDPLPPDCQETGTVAQEHKIGPARPGEPVITQVVKEVKVTPQDNPEYRQYVNHLVGQALQLIPEEDADKISIEDKREIARLTREALTNAVLGKGNAIRKGRVGPLQYQVGAYSYESHWVTRDGPGGAERIRGRYLGLVPFVALKVAKDSDGEKP